MSTKIIKIRLDQLLVERGSAPTRTQAQAMIMAGEVMLGTTVVTKPGQLVPADANLKVASKPRYASRGGDKLASVAEALGLDFAGKTLLDVGSSTGGFTDYALQHGAIHSYCVDVGSNQLAYKLRQDERVTVLERTDIRDLSLTQLGKKPDMAVIDVSFISLTKVLPAVAGLIKPGAPIVAMAKPQFETSKATADKYSGVIKDERVRKGILNDFEAAIKPQFAIQASADSAVTGAKGNRERFYWLKIIKHPS